MGLRRESGASPNGYEPSAGPRPTMERPGGDRIARRRLGSVARAVGWLTRRLAGIILVVSLAAALGLWRSAEKQFHKYEQSRFERVADLTMKGLRNRVVAQQVILAGAGAFFVNSPGQNEEVFRRYIDSLGLENRYPGIKGLAFLPASSATPGEQSPPILAVIDERYRDALRHVADAAPEYKVAQDESCATGAPARTAAVPMEGASMGLGFFWFHAVYRQNAAHASAEQRRGALVGWACAAVDANDMLTSARGVVGDEIDMDLYDGTQETKARLLGDTDIEYGPDKHDKAPFKARRALSIGGRDATVIFNSMPPFDAVVQDRWPIGVLVSGLATSLLLSGLVWSLQRTRSRATAFAHQMTTALRQQSELLGSIIDHIPHFVFWKDRNLAYLGCNAAFAQVAGLTHPSDIVGKTDFDMPWTPEETEFYRRCDRQVIDTGRAMLDIEETLRTAFGNSGICTSKVPLVGADGKIFGMLGIFADITERKRAEETLRTRMAAVDAAADMVVITDRAGTIEYVNPAFTATTGYHADEVIGQTTRMLKSGQQGPEFYESLWKTIASGGVWQGELMNRRKDGTLYPEEMTITPIRDEAGGVVRFVAIKRDITAKKKQALLESERGHLKEAITAMEQVLGIVGHELRSPLAGIRALAEVLLIDRVTVDEQNGFIKSIHDEVVRMSGTINDLLEAARINSGHARWNWSTVEVERMCREAMDGTEPLVDAGRVSLHVVVEPTDLSMSGDADAVRRLVLNLLSNAAKHTPSGSISVKASASEHHGKPWVCIEVADTGSGIAPELVQYLGDAFTLNAGVVGSKHVQGTGLGLSICRGIAAAHGGWMSVQSTLGAGTAMTAMLRADLAEPAQTQTPLRLVDSKLPAGSGAAA